MQLITMLKNIRENLIERPEHFLVNEDLETKFNYLWGVLLLSSLNNNNDDNNIIITEQNINAIEPLIKTMKMPENIKKRLIDTVKETSQEEIKNIVKNLRNGKNEYMFIVDIALILSSQKCEDNEMREMFFIIGDILAIPHYQIKEILNFTKAYIEYDEAKLKKILMQSQGINKKNFINYLEQQGLIIDKYVANEKKFYSNQTIKILDDLIIGEDGIVEFENCNIKFVSGKLCSRGNVIIRNCYIELDEESRISVKDFTCEHCFFTTKGVFKDEKAECIKRQYKNKYYTYDLIKSKNSIFISINNAENVNIYDTKFSHVQFLNTIYVQNSLNVKMEFNSFYNNLNCIYLSENSGLVIENSIFRDNEMNDLVQYSSTRPKTIIKSCNFEKSKENQFLSIYFHYSTNENSIIKNCKFFNGGIYDVDNMITVKDSEYFAAVSNRLDSQYY